MIAFRDIQSLTLVEVLDHEWWAQVLEIMLPNRDHDAGDEDREPPAPPPDCKKIKYANDIMAGRASRQAYERRHVNTHPYQCTSCGWWHLTKQGSIQETP